MQSLPIVYIFNKIMISLQYLLLRYFKLIFDYFDDFDDNVMIMSIDMGHSYYRILIVLVCFILPLIYGKASPTPIPTSEPTYLPGQGIGKHGCPKHGFYSTVSISCIDKNARYSDTDTDIPIMIIKTKNLENYNIK